MGWSHWDLVAGYLEHTLSGLLLQAAPQPGGPAHQAAFQPYVFFAYGAACVLLLLFTVWTIGQSRRLEARLKYLRERFEKAHPGALGDGNGP
jgi:hypothetical protein